MSRSSFLAPFLALLALAPAARPQGDELYDFAEGLRRRKLFDLAKREYERLAGDPRSTADARALADLGRARLLKDAFEDSEPGARAERARETLAAFQSFLRTHGSHPRIREARLAFGDFLMTWGQFQLALAAEAPDPERAEELRKMARDVFQQGIETFEMLLPGADPALASQAELARDIGIYHLALSFPPGQRARAQGLKVALEKLEEFIFPRETAVAGLWAYLYKGLVHREQDDDREALESFEYVCRALSTEEVRHRPDAADLRPLREAALHRLAETLNGEKRFAETSRRVTEVLRGTTAKDLTPAGSEALLELARAQFELGDWNAALRTVQDAGAETASRRTVLPKARSLTAAFLRRIPDPAALDPDVLFGAARGLLEQRRWYEALEYGQLLLRVAPPGWRHLPRAWELVGQAWRGADLPLEAAIVFRQGVEQVAARKEWGADAARLAQAHVHALGAFARQTENAADRERWSEARKWLADRYGEQVGDVLWAEGTEALQARDYRKAREAFLRIDEKSASHELARPYAAACRFREKERDFERDRKDAAAAEALDRACGETIAELDAWFREIDDPARAVADPERRARRVQARAYATLFRAQALRGRAEAAVGDRKPAAWAAVEAALTGFETKHPEPNLVDDALALLSEAQVEQGRLEEAERTFQSLERTAAPAARKRAPAGRIGDAWRARALALEKSDPAQYRALLKRSLRFREAWFALTDAPAFQDWYLLGRDHYEAGNAERCEELLKKALDLLAEDPKFGQPRLPKPAYVQWARLYLAQAWLAQRKFQEAARFLKELHAEKPRDRQIARRYAISLGGTVERKDGRLVEVWGTEDLETAAELWQRLLKGSADHSPEWWDAKFHLMWLVRSEARLKGTSPETANEAVTRLLAQNLPGLPDETRALFDHLKASPPK
jgi:tetratricopeptide (TPR) repeat protein